MTWEPVTLVEIVLPYCNNTFSVAPCTATGTNYCYNTFSTCRDPENFAKGTRSEWYCTPDEASRGVVDGAIPSVVSVSTVPSVINFAGADEDFSGLGGRSRCTITFKDHTHSDIGRDPYLPLRGGDPLSSGTYWTKWIVRNKYRQDVVIRVYEGTAGQSLGEMYKRTYFMTDNTFPDANGFSITGQDPIAMLEADSALIPPASQGEVFSDMTAGQTSMIIAGGTIAEYDTSGVLRIDDELIRYTGRETVDDGLRITGMTRGSFGTVAEEHDAETQVQMCLFFDNVTVDDAYAELTRKSRSGRIPVAYLDLDQWSEQMLETLADYTVYGVVSEPTSAAEIIGRIQLQTLSFLFWDEQDAKVYMRVVKGWSTPPDVLDDDVNFMSFSVEELTDQRITQLWFSYAMRDQTDEDTYKRVIVSADLDAESDNEYGDSVRRDIAGNFTARKIQALDVAGRYMRKYTDVPRRVSFELDQKDKARRLGDVIGISHRLLIDEHGNRSVTYWMITECEPLLRQGKIRYVAEETTDYGRLYYIMSGSAPDYSGTRPEKSAYIGNAAGLLSDGTIGALFS